MICSAVRLELRSGGGRGFLSSLGLLVLAMSVGGTCALAEEAAIDSSRMTFHGDVAPIFKRSCLGCHSGRKPKGKYSMESLGKLLAGSGRGRTIVPGKPTESLLFRMISGKQKPLMPPRKAEPLSEKDIRMIEAWIKGGARAGTPPAGPEPYSRPLAAQVYPRPPVITALLFDSSGENIFIGGYREVLVHGVENLLSRGRGKKEPVEIQPLRRFRGEAERIHALALAPGGGLLAVAGGSPARFGELQLWDVEESRMLRFKRTGGDVFYSVDFSPDGSTLVLAGTDRSLHVLGVEDLELRYSSQLHSDWVLGAVFSSDGKRLFSCGRDGTIRAAAAKDGGFLKTLGTFAQAVTRVVTRPGSSQILVAGEKMEPRIYDAGSLVEGTKLEKQPGLIFAAGYSVDGTKLALAGSAKALRVYDAESGQRIAGLRSEQGWIYALAFNAAGDRLATAGYEGTLRIWDLEMGKGLVEVIPVILERAGK